MPAESGAKVRRTGTRGYRTVRAVTVVGARRRRGSVRGLASLAVRGARRAPSVKGGEVHHLTKGDVITVPAKTPHWFKEVPTKTIAYYAINTEP